jgi:hypothetical protein
MRHYLDLAVGVLSAPVSTLENVTKEIRPGPAALVYVVASTITILGSTLTARIALPLPTPLHLRVILGVPLGLLGMLLYTAALHLTARLLGGRGRAAGLFAGLAFSLLPGVLWGPFVFAMRAAPASFSHLVTAVVAGWVLILQVLTIQACHGFAARRALVVLFFSLLVLAALIILGVTLGAGALFKI